jgi:two-component system, response regulator PdtaR
MDPIIVSRRKCRGRPLVCTGTGKDDGGGHDPASTAGGAKPHPEQGLRILIVEDEWFIAVESEAILRAAGFHVVGIAVSADEAVALAAAERPDLVLMDIRLKGERDGIDAAREMRERFDIPSLFATAHSDPAMRQKAEAAAPAGWISKPFSDQQLVRAVLAALAR